jgi:hypothetical protein
LKNFIIHVNYINTVHNSRQTKQGWEQASF